VIQPLLPVSVVAMLMLDVPPYIYLTLFLFFLVFYWSTYRTQVPYYPSTKKTWLAVEKLLPQDRPVSFVDIGSGLGGLTLYLAQRHSNGKFIGVEIAPLPWLVSFVRQKVNSARASNARFVRGNYDALHFSEFDVVFAYLSPAAMSSLWRKAKKEMRPGSILVSYEFPIIGVDADLSISSDNTLDNSNATGRKLFVWTL
jgi:SAM-dependent methyltransferase